MTTPEEMDESLWRFWNAKALKQADRIEELVKEKDKFREAFNTNRILLGETELQLEDAITELAKAVEALRVALEGLNWAKAYLSTSGIDSDLVNNADANVYAVLAELEGKDHG